MPEYYNAGSWNFDNPRIIFSLADKTAILVNLIFEKDLLGKGVGTIS